MAIILKNLIKVAPFPEDQRKFLLENYGKLTEDQKFKLSNAAWKALTQIFYGKLKAGKNLIQDEVVHGKRKHNPNDYEELEAKLLHEFAQKLESAESEESVEEVREQLEKYKTKPPSQR